ncbi:MAG: class I SAM-dependent methyltransferase [Ktedonobacterales bacterium]
MDLQQDGDALRRWFSANQARLETAYLAGEQPWQQSGFGLHGLRPAEQWATLRRPVAECVSSSGSFLDIGCANGYLLECLLTWTARRGLLLTPFGLDFSAKLVALAHLRLPSYAHQIVVGNAWDWQPAHPFDYVRTELVYVPEELRGEYMTRLLALFLRPGGKLLVAEYRARTDSAPALTVDRELRERGFAVERVVCGCWEGIEQTRVAVVARALP